MKAFVRLPTPQLLSTNNNRVFDADADAVVDGREFE